MNTAIDTSVLLAVFNGEPSADEWLTALISARSAGRLMICEVVYAELAPAFTHAEILDEKLAVMGIEVVSTNKESAWLAGKAFQPRNVIENREKRKRRESRSVYEGVSTHPLSERIISCKCRISRF